MSITVNATLLQGQLHEGSISANDADYVLDGAINLLNAFGAGLDSLTGAIGVHTGLYTSAQVGAILAMAQQIYAKHYKNASGTAGIGLGGANLSYSNDLQLLAFAEKLAERLKSSSIAFVVAEDTSGLDEAT